GDGQVHWGFITVPPVSGSPAMSGGGGAGSSAGVSEPAVEVTRIVTDEAGNVVRPAPTATRDSSGSGVSSAAPMPVQSAGPLLELGETVTLTGTIAGTAVWSG